MGHRAVTSNQIPKTLSERSQWVLWKEVERDGKPTKLPFQLNGRAGKSNDPSIWSPFDKVITAYGCGSWDGPGYVFSETDEFCGIDLDGCRDPKSETIANWAQQVINQFCTYIEVSPSQTGVKLFCIGKNPLNCGKNLKINQTPVVPGKEPGVEIYDKLRYFAVTGWKLDDKPAEPQECQKQIDEFCAKFWPPKPDHDHRDKGQSNGSPRSSIIERARKYIAKMPGAISGQGGHNAAFSVACVLVLGFDLSTDEAFPLYAEWNATCEPPWSEAEMRHKLEDATKEPGERGHLLNSQKHKRNGSSSGNGEATHIRPQIEITTEEHIVNDQAVTALTSDETIFQRNGNLVHVIQIESGEERGIHRPDGMLKIVTLPKAIIREKLTACANFVTITFKKNEEIIVPKSPPGWCVDAVSERGMWNDIRYLQGVVTNPVLRPDGSVFSTPGYDPVTRLLYHDAGLNVEIIEKPNQDDAVKACNVLFDVMRDFPFASVEHQSAWLAFQLTVIGRSAFSGPSPLFLIDSNAAGSGKGLSADITSIIGTGSEAPRMANAKNDEEWAKKITSIAMAGDALILIDNVSGKLGSPSLDAALTGTIWKDRVLKENRMVEAPLRMVWAASGNNVQLVGDTCRRTVHIRFNSLLERPEERKGFKYPNLKDHVRKERGKLLSAAITILQAYCLTGRPQESLKPWGSYESWSDLIRGAVVWIGLPDPGDTRQELVTNSDRDASAIRSLINNWNTVDPDGEGITAARLLKILDKNENEYPEVREAICELCNARGGSLPTVRSLGNRLRHLRHRNIGGKFFDNRLDRKGIQNWLVIDVE